MCRVGGTETIHELYVLGLSGPLKNKYVGKVGVNWGRLFEGLAEGLGFYLCGTTLGS